MTSSLDLSQEGEDVLTQLAKGDILNYKSVVEDVNNARIELERYQELGYAKVVPKDIVEKEMANGTISRLGLILKQKENELKRRIIIDLRRSGGNRKSELPEKIVLPKPSDGLAAVRKVHEMAKERGPNSAATTELAVIDISDAYMTMGIHQDELPHTHTHWHHTSRTRTSSTCLWLCCSDIEQRP